MSLAAGGRIAVLSPHLDDAAFSLGATIAREARAGADVRVVTVLANDPESDQPPSDWDLACGFGSTGEAARARRAEDLAACSLLGATPVWLAFRDSDHGAGNDREEVRRGIARELEWADVVLAPGYPLLHPDHVWLTRMLIQIEGLTPRLGFYVEQPYATWRLIGRGRRAWAAPGLTFRRGIRNLLEIVLRTPAGRALQEPALPPELAGATATPLAWRAAPSGRRAWLTKQRAVHAYESQLRGFGPLVGSRMAVYELAYGGEAIALAH